MLKKLLSLEEIAVLVPMRTALALEDVWLHDDGHVSARINPDLYKSPGIIEEATQLLNK